MKSCNCVVKGLTLQVFLQEEKFQKAEDLTEEAKRAAREAHLKAEEALRKAQAAQTENEKAAIDRGLKQEDSERLQHIKKLVRCCS